MNVLKVTISNSSPLRPVVTIDGKEIKGEKTGGGNERVYSYATENASARVRIFNVLEASSPLYYLMSLLAFVLSLFGIFDSYADFKCRRIIFDATVSVSGAAELKLTPKRQTKSDGEAFKYVGTQAVSVDRNETFIDKPAKRRTVFMTFVRIILFVGAIIGSIYLLVERF